MIMTPEEAKTKWCPHKRVALVQGMAANYSGNMSPVGGGYGNIHEESRCEADGCANWRWTNTLHAMGYCGLAGRPTEK